MSDESTEGEKEFFAEAEVMDLSPIRGKQFCVAVSTGNPNGTQYLCSTLRGPYDFSEMVQEVGEIWVTEQHHPKVVVLEKDKKVKLQVLDANTVDYLEAHYTDILMEEALANFDDKEFTCVAGTVEEPEAEKTT